MRKEKQKKLSLLFAILTSLQLLNEKISTNQKPGDNSLYKGLNEERILLRQLLVSTIELLTLSFYLEIKFSRKIQCSVKSVK